MTYFIRGNEYYILNNNETVPSGYPKKLSDKYPGLGLLPKINQFDTALGLRNKMYFFSGNKYYEYTNTLGEPVNLNSVGSIFKGIPSHFDCVMAREPENENSELYFFKGSQIYMFNKGTNKMVEGFPKKINELLPECPSNINACFHDGNNIYIFKNNLVYKYITGGSC